MQVLVIGAGVVGLACARAAALAGHEVIVAEATGGIGNGVSSRNSEVIHAGMYYPTGSLRAKHCVQGRRMLYDFCGSHGVPHQEGRQADRRDRRQQTAKIEGIYRQGQINGVEGLEFLGGNAARAMEPALFCVAAMLSPETGIIDSHSFMLALEGDLEDRGGMIAFNTTIERLTPAASGWEVRFGGAETGTLAVDAVINSAGLGAQALARAHGRLSAGARAEARARQGQLLRLRRPPGVLAPDLSGAGRGRARHPRHARHGGPHALRPGRRVDRRARATRSIRSARRVVLRQHPHVFARTCRTIRSCRTIAASAPSSPDKGEPAADFMIEGPAEHGLPRLVNLFGIESPGLTSSLSIAADVAQLLARPDRSSASGLECVGR